MADGSTHPRFDAIAQLERNAHPRDRIAPTPQQSPLRQATLRAQEDLDNAFKRTTELRIRLESVLSDASTTEKVSDSAGERSPGVSDAVQAMFDISRGANAISAILEDIFDRLEV